MHQRAGAADHLVDGQGYEGGYRQGDEQNVAGLSFTERGCRGGTGWSPQGTCHRSYGFPVLGGSCSIWDILLIVVMLTESGSMGRDWLHFPNPACDRYLVLGWQTWQVHLKHGGRAGRASLSVPARSRVGDRLGLLATARRQVSWDEAYEWVSPYLSLHQALASHSLPSGDSVAQGLAKPEAAAWMTASPVIHRYVIMEWRHLGASQGCCPTPT